MATRNEAYPGSAESSDVDSPQGTDTTVRRVTEPRSASQLRQAGVPAEQAKPAAHCRAPRQATARVRQLLLLVQERRPAELFRRSQLWRRVFAFMGESGVRPPGLTPFELMSGGYSPQSIFPMSTIPCGVGGGCKFSGIAACNGLLYCAPSAASEALAFDWY